MAKLQADCQQPFGWALGDDDTGEVWDELLTGLVHDDGAITFRVYNSPDAGIAWEEDGNIEVVLESELAQHIVATYESIHGNLAAAERERALREDNERLRGKCNRLIGGFWYLYDHINERDGEIKAFAWALRDDAGLHPGDLTPEPHGAASDTPDTEGV